MLINRFLPIFLSCCLAIAACNDPTNIGQSLIDEDELFETTFTDTFAVTVHTKRSDTTITSSSTYLPQGYLLGNTNDPIFGRSNASIYAQLAIPTDTKGLPTSIDSIEIDSVVLSLAYETDIQAYGDTTSKHNVAVYELEEAIIPKAYFAEQHFGYNPTPIGYINNIQFKHRTKVQLKLYSPAYTEITSTDTIVHNDTIKQQTSNPQLRIPINPELGWRIFSRIGTQELKTTDNFRNFFKGIYIKTNENGNAMSFINSTSSGITIYYKQGSQKGKSSTFPLSGGVINHYDHQYNNTPVGNNLNMPYPNGQIYTYLQGINGTQFEFEVPSFKALHGKLINKVSLEMTLLPDIDTTFLPPIQLSSYAIDSSGNRVNIYSNADKPSNGNYAYYITKIEQDGTDANGAKIWKHSLNYRDFTYEFTSGKYKKIVVRTYPYLPYRAVICGPEHPQYPMRWKVYYTDVE